ncbi:MAG: hypothetical protein KDB61_11585 [Planctomycetes bacterium]|nr:hypothetical protein [Planctomycetota bacterium]
MNYIRSFITLLIVTLIVIAAYGVLWWENPPTPIANYQNGANVILSALVGAGIIGIWQLWTGPSPEGHSE